MTPIQRIGLALGLVVVDFIMFIAPLGSCLLAYVLIARPPWFLALVKEVYRDG